MCYGMGCPFENPDGECIVGGCPPSDSEAYCIDILE